MNSKDLVKRDNCKKCGNQWYLPVENNYKCSTCGAYHVFGVDHANGCGYGSTVSGKLDNNGDLIIDSVSFVSSCPYCGSKDWDTPKVMPNGITCKHPTKLRRVR